WEDIKALKRWVGLSRKEQLAFKLTKTLEKEIESYYFGLYSSRWLPESRQQWGKLPHTLDAADAMARIPTIMMWDDHDIFDGWGSYSSAMQHCELFQTMFRYARKAFWVFQMQHVLEDLPDLEYIARPNVSKQDPLFKKINWGLHQQKDAFALPLLNDQPGFSF